MMDLTSCGGIEMSRFFVPGEKVFMTTGIEVMEAVVDKNRYGRYVVSYKGHNNEAQGHICISGNRLYRSYDEAVSHITRPSDVYSNKTEPCLTAHSYRADEPGDGWARR